MSVKEKAEEIAEKVVKNKGITPLNQKRVWARTTVLKRLVVKAGLISEADFDKEVESMVADIERVQAEKLRETMGLDES